MEGISKDETEIVSSESSSVQKVLEEAADIMTETEPKGNMEPVPKTSTTSEEGHTEDSEQDPEFENRSQSDSSDSDLDNEFNWRPISGEIGIVEECIAAGVGPRDILPRILPNFELPDVAEDSALWHLIIQVLTEPPRRRKLPQHNTFADAIGLIKSASKILVLTGAGISVSCGIPDFRSKDGIYSRLHTDFPDLPDPQAMFDINFFRKNPLPFYSFAKEIYPGKFAPSVSHKFIALLEKENKLLRNYTQNIDTLEQVAGISKVIQCHGSFAKASCCSCKRQVDCEAIRSDIENSVVPRCTECPENSEFPVMKPDIVFFGEGLPKEFHDQLGQDKQQVDLLIVIGSSLKVRPVALIPNSIPAEVPQILINNEPLRHLNFDIELIGSCDEIIEDICTKLGSPWSDTLSATEPPLQQIILDTPAGSDTQELEVNSETQATAETAIETEHSSSEEKDCNLSVSAIDTDSCSGKSAENLKQASNGEQEPACKKARIEPAAELSENDITLPQTANDPSSGTSRPNNPTDENHLTEVDGAEPNDSNLSCDSDASIEIPSDEPDPLDTIQLDPLPPNSFYLIPPNRSVFRGAKIFETLSDRIETSDISTADTSNVGETVALN